jgi:hypothetical protein
VWIAAAAFVLSACSTTEAPEAPPPPAAPPAPQSPAPQSPAPASPPAEADRCGAGELQWLVGRPKSQIPVPVDPTRRRVVCSTCVMTMDYNPERLTIVFETGSGLVQSVRCG